ncbi:dihydrolipoamide acetyltransferase family protein [Cryobacterium sp. CG_9.6]|uniref:dihydrolipoamide acetyltransferase family protein n=1 Tax=Cryobacterium sp. CG_9.6 TaxID=2760710 RepID=UPI002476EFE0|nr:dihydrolipoamide acetyltransferase family protein [Cryobacterium sp. CG_9.6]MDH6236582.1 pyruvate dehydrogenase E2 component (dihydrolipoamide acetyltransferase) [Cryobacterium sp. CG_9.6]
MLKIFKLPDLGEGLTESEIVAWYISPGDTVSLNQHIADVETAKAVVELPSPFSGVVSELHQPAGVVVHVGEPIVSFTVADAAGAASGSTKAPEASVVPAEEREANLVGYGPAVERGGRPARRTRPGTAASSTAVTTQPPAPPVTRTLVVPASEITVTSERPRSTPPVRALARDLGVNLETVTGTGPGGLITRDDVRTALDGAVLDGAVLASTAPESATPVGAGALAGASARETRTPIKSIRKLTAAAMVSSAFTAPHVTEFLTIDVTPTMELLDSLKTNRAFADQRISILTVVAKAVCIAITRNPAVNTKWDEAAGEIVQFGYVNLGIAAATPRGLMVPNIKDADTLGLTALAAALAELTTAARGGTTTPAALGGGTISITNIGVFGIDAGTPILNPGEAAILAMGAIRTTPWEYHGQVALRQVLTLSLSFDHRLVDGEQGSRFLADIGTILANPAMVITMV